MIIEPLRPALTLKAKLILGGVILVTGGFVALVVLAVFPPRDFPANSFIHVDRGKSVSLIAGELKAKELIRSETAFKVLMKLFGETRMQIGTYFFGEPISVVNVALKLSQHFLGYLPYRVTVFEGMSNAKIAVALTKAIPDFPVEEFLAKTKDLEGQLFPDTYFFPPEIKVDDIIFELRQNWRAQITSLRPDLLRSGRSLDEIMIMASLIEREARTEEDQRLVSGILWQRLKLNMLLQVDATFEYYTDYNTYTITKAELKKDSPYNTYVNKGLPPTPIANPGRRAILAAIYPAESPYLYYLTGRDGQMRYAEDFAGHKENRRLYLD